MGTVGVAGKGKSLHEKAGDLINGDFSVVEYELAVSGGGWPLVALIKVQVSTVISQALGVHAV